MKKYLYHGEPISWSVDYNPYCSYAYVANVSMRDYFENPDAVIHCYEVGKQWVEDTFQGRLPVLPPMLYPISYGHLICLGATYTMPDNSDLNMHAFASSLDEAIDILKKTKGIDFSKNELVQKYISDSKVLQAKYPELNLPITLPSSQGPITSAVLMRGQDFYLDLYDEPEKTLEFIRLMTDSILDYQHFCRKINNQPLISPSGARVYDDFASLVSPHLFSTFVIPAWNQMFEGLTTGSRFVHCEDLYPQHLQYLKEAKLDSFQPSVSDKLTLENYFANTDVPLYDWLLYSWLCADFDESQIRDWIHASLAGGARKLRTQFNQATHKRNRIDRIISFIDAFDEFAI